MNKIDKIYIILGGKNKMKKNKMKKFIVGVSTFLALASTQVFGAEIVPEYFLMERLILQMEVAPTYISTDGNKEVRAMQVNSDVMNMLDTNESPFYVYDSNGEKKVVRMGDYFISPKVLSSIFVADRESFETTYRDIKNPEQKIITSVEKMQETIDLSDIEEKNNKGVMSEN